MSDSCCTKFQSGGETAAEFETIRIEKVKKSCGTCEKYSADHAQKEVAVISCEGACLRGEVARQASNMLCHSLARSKTARICLGGAFTKDTGQRDLVRKAKKVLVVEGCFLKCASRMMKGVLPETKLEAVVADEMYEFDRKLFGIDEMPGSQITEHAQAVAKQLAEKLAPLSKT